MERAPCDLLAEDRWHGEPCAVTPLGADAPSGGYCLSLARGEGVEPRPRHEIVDRRPLPVIERGEADRADARAIGDLSVVAVAAESHSAGQFVCALHGRTNLSAGLSRYCSNPATVFGIRERGEKRR